MASSPPTLRLGTRASALARWQTDWVRAQLRQAWPGLDCQAVVLTTTGDRLLDRPLPEIGGKGLFTQELEAALRAGEIDLAVHSLKDLPIDDAPGLALGAIPPRADARDVLISRAGHRFADLPVHACVGTSSLRRAAQLLAARPDLALQPLRGNVDTRVRKALSGDYDAIVLAAAGVLRLDLDAHIGEYLSFDVMLPAPGQGALAVQCRAGDQAVLERLQPLDHAPTRAAVAAERAFLSGLGGGCAAPVAAYALPHLQGSLALTGLVAARDGQQVIRVEAAGADPLRLGLELARLALAEGAGALLA
jgi:hydroxymethylbilane synthase